MASETKSRIVSIYAEEFIAIVPSDYSVQLKLLLDGRSRMASATVIDPLCRKRGKGRITLSMIVEIASSG